MFSVFKIKEKGSIKIIALLIPVLLTFGGSCVRHQPGEKVEVKMMRFEKDLLDTGAAMLDNEHFSKLRSLYGEFYQSFVRDILQSDTDDVLNFSQGGIAGFVRFPAIRLIYHDVDSVYPTLHEQEAALSEAMSWYKVYFPSQRIPVFVSFISEFSVANAAFDTIIGIGLDMYVGAHYAPYKALDFPLFMINKLRKEYLVSNTVKTLVTSRFENQLKDRRMLANMLFEGKVRYAMKKLLPHTDDSIIFGYTAKQMTWCSQNEHEIWAHLLEKKLLFSDEATLYMRYLNDGPFTSAPGVPNESAPAIGIFAGYKIIDTYMSKHSELKLSELMSDNNWDHILKESAYRP